MQSKTLQLAERLIPDFLQERLNPLLQKADEILSGSDDNAVSQRMALIVFFIRVSSAAIVFLSQVLLARWMGTLEYGIFVAVWAGVIIASTLTALGLPSVVVRFVAEYKEQNQHGLLWGMIHGGMWLSFSIATLLSTMAAAFLYFFPGTVTNYFVMPIFLGILCLPAFSIEDVSDTAARPFNWSLIAFLPTYIIKPLSTLILFGSALVLGFEASAVTAMWCALISTYSATLIQYIALQIKLKRTVEPAKPEYRFKHWVLVALPIFLVESFYVLVTQVDVLFVSWLTDPEQTAVYFAATKVLALVHFVYFAVRASASHRFAAYNSSGRREEFHAFVQKTVSWTFWPSLLLGLLMVMLGKFILMMFGSEFISGQAVLAVLMIGIVTRSAVGPAEALLVMSGNQNACALVYGCALSVNVILNFTLIPMYGMMGAAIATALALGFETLALYAMVKRKLGIHAFIIPAKSPAKLAPDGPNDHA